MNKIYYVAILTFMISNIDCSKSNYPNCVKALSEEQFSSTEINSNKNFISLSQFIIKLDTKTQNYFKNEANNRIQNGEISAQRISEESEYQYLMSYLIIFGTSALFAFVLIFMRAKASYDKSFRKFVSRTMEIAITPSLVVSAIVWVTFLFIFWSYTQQFPAYISSAQCSQTYIKDLLLYGDNRSDWAGLYGFEKIINSQIKYMESIETIPTTYFFELLPIKNRKNQRMSYANQFLLQYYNASISYTSVNSVTNSIDVRDLLPELLSKYQNERIILGKLNESEKTLSTISELSIHIEAILNDLNITIPKSKLSLLKMLPSYKMPAEVIQKGNIFFPLLKQSEGKSSRLLYQLDRNYYLKLFSTVFIGVGMQQGISYLCLILFSLKIRYNLIIKLTNFLWILLICEFLLGIPIIFLYNTVITQVRFQCSIFDSFLTNRTTYYSYQNNEPSSKNAFKVLQPCLFESYDRYTKKTSIGNFTNFPDLEKETAGFINFHTNLSTLINMMDPGSTPFEYDESINEAIQYIEDQKSNNLNAKWDYLNQLLDQVNNYTLNDILNSQCYKHAWQFSSESCPKSMSILPPRDNNLIVSTGSYLSSEPVCLIFTSDLSQVLSNYKLNQSRCVSTFNQIEPLILQIVQVMQTRDYVLNSIIADLQTQRENLNEYLRILRTNYLLKKDMYQYVVTLERTVPLDRQSIKNWQYAGAQHNNCTCIKTWLDKIYNNTCINMRSDLLKAYLILLISQIFLMVLLIFGFMYGVNEEVKQIEHQEMDNDILSPSQQRISNGQLNAKPVQNKYINQFFSASQKNQ